LWDLDHQKYFWRRKFKIYTNLFSEPKLHKTHEEFLLYIEHVIETRIRPTIKQKWEKNDSWLC